MRGVFTKNCKRIYTTSKPACSPLSLLELLPYPSCNALRIFHNINFKQNRCLKSICSDARNAMTAHGVYCIYFSRITASIDNAALYIPYKEAGQSLPGFLQPLQKRIHLFLRILTGFLHDGFLYIPQGFLFFGPGFALLPCMHGEHREQDSR